MGFTGTGRFSWEWDHQGVRGINFIGTVGIQGIRQVSKDRLIFTGN
jgi:hypothetical protein